jgi:hypothetical protein
MDTLVVVGRSFRRILAHADGASASNRNWPRLQRDAKCAKSKRWAARGTGQSWAVFCHRNPQKA